MTDIVCVGYACADVFMKGVDLNTPFLEETKPCEDIMMAVGGDAANEAIVMSRLGADVKIVSGVGDDAIASFIETTLTNAGVDTSGLNRTEESATSIVIVVVHPDGQRNFIARKDVVPSALFEVDTEELNGAKIISLGSMMIPPLVKAEQIQKILKEAKKKGITVCADVVCMPDGDKLEDIGDALSCIDYIFPNKEEAMKITGESTLDGMADKLLGYGIKNVLIKIGKDGCFVKNTNESFITPCIGPKGIDTTGAGDNFAAGFITALNEGKSLKDCCIFASATAGVACQSVGSNTGVKSRKQVEEFLEKYY